jgi:hypothetical protein
VAESGGLLRLPEITPKATVFANPPSSKCLGNRRVSGDQVGTLQKRRVKPASIRGPIFVPASTVPRSVPIRGAARVLGLTHQRVHQLTQNEAEKR